MKYKVGQIVSLKCVPDIWELNTVTELKAVYGTTKAKIIEELSMSNLYDYQVKMMVRPGFNIGRDEDGDLFDTEWGVFENNIVRRCKDSPNRLGNKPWEVKI